MELHRQRLSACIVNSCHHYWCELLVVGGCGVSSIQCTMYATAMDNEVIP